LDRAACVVLVAALCGGGAVEGAPLPMAVSIAACMGIATGILIGSALLRARPDWARAWLWTNAAGWGPAIAVGLVAAPAVLDLGVTAALGLSAAGVGLLGGSVLSIAAGGASVAPAEGRRPA
jgi:hypothetical protein